jgi:hypothetical protein
MDAAEEFNGLREATNHAQVPDEERKDLIHPAEEKEKIVTAKNRAEIAGDFQWQWSLNWIIAPRAVYVDGNEDWLNARHMPRCKS